MLNEKIKELRSILNERAEETNGMIDDAQAKASDGDLEGAKEIKTQIEAKKKEIAELEVKLAELEDLAGMKKTESRSVERKGEKRMEKIGKTDEEEVRDALNSYLRTKVEQRDKITSNDVGVLIPKEILTKVEKEVNEKTDLSKLVTIKKVNRPQGSVPVLKSTSQRFNSTEELEANPELSKPQFKDVDYKVDTKRGAIPLSQESIDDADEDLTPLVAGFLKEIELNTKNFDISEKLKKMPKKDSKSLDDLKKIKNVDIKKGYKIVFVATQSLYNVLDTLKDNEGKYVLQPSVSSPSGMALFGHDMEVVEDELFGENGNTNYFVGDTKRAIVYADRKQLFVKWVDSNIYGEYLQGGLRSDTIIADENAGFFGEFKVDSSTKPEPEKEPETKTKAKA